MPLVFISYRREDSAGFAGRLHESLERRLGEGEIFRDVDAIEPGQDFVDAINTRLRQCKACLVLIGREWLDVTDEAGRRRLEQQNDYVRFEIAAALARPEVLTIPVLVEGASMPAAGKLPESIAALSRRQAVSLRDDTWDSDVDRLVSAFSWEAVPSAAPRRPDRRALKWAAAAVALLALILVVLMFQRSDDRADAPPSSSAGAPDRATEVAPAYAIAIPRLSEVAYGDLIYTVLSGGVTRYGSSSTLRLRIRFSNEGRYPANFWDRTFRLAMPGQVLAPTSDLNAVVDGHSLQQGIVSFEVPAGAGEVVLRVLGQDQAADIPLNLKSTGAPSDADKTDTTDALSRAVVAPIVREARPLASGPLGSYTLVSATARRFVNSIRIAATVRMTNLHRYPGGFGPDAIRLLVDGQNAAPVKAPNEVVQPNATVMADFVFDIPPSARKVTLQAKADGAAEMPLDLPASVR